MNLNQSPQITVNHQLYWFNAAFDIDLEQL